MSERQATKETIKELLIETQIEAYHRTPRKDFTRVRSCSGSHVVYDAALSVNEKGEQIAEPGQKLDWFGYIQASEKSCDLHNIVARYLQGDMSVVNVNANPLYGDIASMPKNVNELQDLAKRAKDGYDELSDEVKGIFNNSFEDFYNAVLNGSVDSKIKAYAAAKVEAAEKEAAAAKKLADEAAQKGNE